MRIWAVGGGKGGTGKSLVANGLGIRLAEQGGRVILVDADYGAPNQHTYCGIRKPATSLMQFFDQRKPLEEIELDTPIQGLRLIPGNVNSHNTDNLTVTQKQKLFRHLKHLVADHVVLDLGAGTQYDILDTFLLADVQVAVVAPDTLSIENFYLFLKNLQYRQLSNVLSWTGLKDQAREAWKDRAEHGISTTRDLVAHLRGLSEAFSEMLSQEQRRLKPHLVLNQVHDFKQVEIGFAVSAAVAKFFHLPISFAGHVHYDKDLWQRFGHDSPAIHHESSFTLKQDIERIAEGILHPSFLEAD